MSRFKNIPVILCLLACCQIKAGTPNMFLHNPQLPSVESIQQAQLAGKENFRRIKLHAVKNTVSSSPVLPARSLSFGKTTRTENTLVAKLIRSNLKLSFKVSKTLRLTISYF